MKISIYCDQIYQNVMYTCIDKSQFLLPIKFHHELITGALLSYV